MDIRTRNYWSLVPLTVSLSFRSHLGGSSLVSQRINTPCRWRSTQDSAGTAVCIALSGLLLTCSHCISEDAEGPEESETHLATFSSKRTAQTKCTAFDTTRDLALLQIIAAQPPVPNRLPSSVPHLTH
jgi:S1-C subfamily serine protease